MDFHKQKGLWVVTNCLRLKVKVDRKNDLACLDDFQILSEKNALSKKIELGFPKSLFEQLSAFSQHNVCHS